MPNLGIQPKEDIYLRCDIAGSLYLIEADDVSKVLPLSMADIKNGMLHLNGSDPVPIVDLGNRLLQKPIDFVNGCVVLMRAHSRIAGFLVSSCGDLITIPRRETKSGVPMPVHGFRGAALSDVWINNDQTVFILDPADLVQPNEWEL